MSDAASPSAAAADRAPSGVRVWLLAIRPATLPAAVGPVFVGLGAAIGSGAAFRLDTALGCLAVALLLQIAANLANDLADFRRGADTPDRMGPTRVAAAGLLTERRLEAGIGAVIAGSAVFGLYLAIVGGISMLVLGALAVVSALAYTGGPWPYGYRGLGEVFVFAFFGLMAVGVTAYLQAGRVEWMYLLAAVPMGALITGILIVNNLRDIPTDRAAGKRTLAVIFGEGFAKAEYYVTLAVAAAIPVVLLVARLAGPAVLLPLLSGLTVPPLVREVRAVGPGSDRRRLNLVLKGTARLSLGYGVLFAIGLAVRVGA
ncbi:MAG: 1,4-dihydroxy-2-naphthoate polyprenyltransferase [Candidatus Limnocylindrales bacterium]|jgi:1,4-dihydroxy-2-naphthoate octaprenyltransferase